MSLELLSERFWPKVAKTDDGCWEWQSSCTKMGYGQFQVRKLSKLPFYAHRVSFMIHKGEIPEGKQVCHTCDNPKCVNPEHLFLGSQTDNNRDRQNKGRTASGDKNGARTQRHKNSFVKNGGSGRIGELHPMAKLTSVQIENLRKEFAGGVTKAALSRKYKLSQTHVGKIVKGLIRKTS